MGDVIDHVETRHALGFEEKHRLAFLLAEYGNQNIGAADFLLTRGLHMEHRALQYALEAERRLRFAVVAGGEKRCSFAEKCAEFLLQLVEIRATGFQYLGRARIIQQCEQQVLDCHKFVSFFPRLLEGEIQGELQFLAQHV